MRKAVRIWLPQPCSENWEQMTAATRGRHCVACQKTVVERGRHCATCQKTVVDFRGMSDAALARFFRMQKDVKVIRTSGSAGLDAEALRVVSTMPAWLPATAWGRPLRSVHKIKINFRQTY